MNGIGRLPFCAGLPPAALEASGLPVRVGASARQTVAPNMFWLVPK